MKHFHYVLFCIMAIMPGFAVAAEQYSGALLNNDGVSDRTGCVGETGTDDTFDGKSLVIWQGTMTRLDVTGNWNGDDGGTWFAGENYERSSDAGNVGQCNGTSCNNGDYQTCWSLSRFTLSNTNGGETCTNEGPLAFTTSTTYYIMQIDRSSSPTAYCQIAMETGPTDDPNSRGDTYVVALEGEPVATPVMPSILLLALATLMGVIGFMRARVSTRG